MLGFEASALNPPLSREDHKAEETANSKVGSPTHHGDTER
jgi:hypothetical protein